MAKTTIDWCDYVWNPVTGCSKVSEGCRNCYAEKIAHRFWGERKFTEVQCHHDRLEIDLNKWPLGKKIFVNSMSDLFHDDVPFEFIFDVLRIIRKCFDQTFIVLTKRPERMVKFFDWLYGQPYVNRGGVLANLWLGVSVEDQKTADERIPFLFQIPATVRFVSCEPLLAPVNLRLGCYRVEWVICGGESGPQARPVNSDWVRGLRDQCLAADVPFFFKQWGPNKKAGCLIDGVEYRQWPTILEQ